jgi:hypothetical protein
MRRRDCDKIPPSRLNTTGFTHVVLTFAVFDPKTFAVGPMHPGDEETYKQFLKLSDTFYKWIVSCLSASCRTRTK